MFSGLELVDGPWYGYDIDQLRAVPDVVLLSACEVGRSTVRWGEELIGMTSAWLHAGSRCVIASAAAVNDEAAFDVLVRVHERLAAGVDPAAALAGRRTRVSRPTRRRCRWSASAEHQAVSGRNRELSARGSYQAAGGRAPDSQLRLRGVSM